MELLSKDYSRLKGIQTSDSIETLNYILFLNAESFITWTNFIKAFGTKVSIILHFVKDKRTSFTRLIGHHYYYHLIERTNVSISENMETY